MHQHSIRLAVAATAAAAAVFLATPVTAFAQAGGTSLIPYTLSSGEKK